MRVRRPFYLLDLRLALVVLIIDNGLEVGPHAETHRQIRVNLQAHHFSCVLVNFREFGSIHLSHTHTPPDDAQTKEHGHRCTVQTTATSVDQTPQTQSLHARGHFVAQTEAIEMRPNGCAFGHERV